MSGRLKQNVFQYDSDGYFLKKYESKSEVELDYPSIKPNQLFRNIKDKIFHKLPDNTYLSKERYVRDKLLLEIKRNNDPLIITENKYDDKKEIEFLNSDKIVIASFHNIKIASLLTNISPNEIHSIMNSTLMEYPKNKYKIYIKYK